MKCREQLSDRHQVGHLAAENFDGTSNLSRLSINHLTRFTGDVLTDRYVFGVFVCMYWFLICVRPG